MSSESVIRDLVKTHKVIRLCPESRSSLLKQAKILDTLLVGSQSCKSYLLTRQAEIRKSGLALARMIFSFLQSASEDDIISLCNRYRARNLSSEHFFGITSISPLALVGKSKECLPEYTKRFQILIINNDLNSLLRMQCESLDQLHTLVGDLRKLPNSCTVRYFDRLIPIDPTKNVWATRNTQFGDLRSEILRPFRLLCKNYSISKGGL